MDEFDSKLISRDLFKRFNGCRIYLRNSRYNDELLFPCIIGGYRLVNNSLKVRQYDGVYCICFNSRHLLNQTYYLTPLLYCDRRLHSIINDDKSIATIHFITRFFVIILIICGLIIIKYVTCIINYVRVKKK